MVMEDRDAATTRVIQNLKRLYKEKLLPLETLYSYSNFFSHSMTDSEFDSKPQVLMIGQYSTGKTSFIKYLIGRDFPGQRIGPEPTTDRFVCVMNNPEERVVPGNALSVAPDLPFSGLQQFGVSFLNKLEGSQVSEPFETRDNLNFQINPPLSLVLSLKMRTIAHEFARRSSPPQFSGTLASSIPPEFSPGRSSASSAATIS